MGGPRAVSERQVDQGIRCARCLTWLGRPQLHRLCPHCTPPKPVKHRVLMNFFLQDGWQVSWLEADCKTPIGRGRTFADDWKLRDLWERCAESRVLSERHALDAAISKGRGAVWLLLTEEQCQKLRG